MAVPTRLSEFLESVILGEGAAPAIGAIVFVSLDRTLDKLVQLGLGLGPYHRGRPSWWSHTFLLAGSWIGPITPILECSVRTEDNKIIWDEDYVDPIKLLRDENILSGICRGIVGDYDDPRVMNWGFKWLPELAATQRDALVADASDPKWKPYRYDFPGLLRELIRLATAGLIEAPAGSKRLFCSGFVQAVYANVLGAGGHFVPGIQTDDTTPDDLWYSPLGQHQARFEDRRTR